jgi:hypothetical protein
MTDFEISEYADYDAFAREWHADDRGGVALADAREVASSMKTRHGCCGNC